MKLLAHKPARATLSILLFLVTIFSFLSTPTPIRAAMPERNYVLAQMFSILRFIRPPLLRVYENRDRDRTYPPLMVCGYAGADRRATECVSGPAADKMCTGDVDICNRQDGGFHHTERNVQGKCRVPKVVDANGDKKEPPPGTPGTCDYTVTPRLSNKVMSTDYSNVNKSTIVYPKLQNEASYYDNLGDDNLLSWGSHNLLLDNCSRTIRQVIVVIKAKQTKATVNQTGQWPLGWVDWEYKTPNGKTLIEINDELPDSVASSGLSIVEAMDTFYSTVGGTVKGIGSKQQAICDSWNEAIRGSGENWASDLAQAPVYPPAVKQGFVRGSVCVYDRCCPSVGSTCPLGAGQNVGGSQGLYTDASVQQAYFAALDDLFITYRYDDALDIYRKLVIKNPALRWATRADAAATPPEVRKKLEEEMKSAPWLEALPNGLNFKLAWLGTVYDYQQKMDIYGYQLQPRLTKQLGGAYYENPLQALINVIWPGSDRVDVVEPITYHLISVPEILGQSLAELQTAVYNTRDTAEVLLDKYNETITSTIDNGSADKLDVGKELNAGDSQRRLAYFTCDDAYFSSQKDTAIEQYALGTRIGCDAATAGSAGLCDGSKFEAIIKNSLWKEPLPAAKQLILNSKMFVGGKLNPDLEAAYARASEETGVPCEVLAGHHFEEGSAAFTEAGGDPTKVSVANGGPASQDGGLENSAIIAANAILRHPFSTYQELITSMSNFNGGGNANCGVSPYSGCPKKFAGEDDPYVTNMLDAKHGSMYLIYCGDFQKCAYGTPYGTDRPGAFAVALVVHQFIQSANPSPSAGPTASGSPLPQSVRDQIDPTGKCGGNAIDTALGCLPYERTAAIAALLRLLGGTAGALALGSMLFATFLIMTGAGDPKKIQKGRELFSSAIMGLLFLIFAGAILRIVAQQILRLPGF